MARLTGQNLRRLVLVSFNNGDLGGNPIGGLVADVHGNLFGITLRGGANGHGTVFEVTGSGFAALPR